MNINKKLLIAVLVVAAFNQSASAVPLAYTLLAFFLVGSNDQIRRNVPLAAGTQDYVLETTKDGAYILATTTLGTASGKILDAYELSNMAWQKYRNTDDAYTHEVKPDIALTHKKVLIRADTGEITEEPKDWFGWGADKLRTVAPSFMTSKKTYGEYISVESSEKNPLVVQDEQQEGKYDVFYDSHAPKSTSTAINSTPTTSKIKSNDSKPSTTSGSYWNRFLPSLYLF